MIEDLEGTRKCAVIAGLQDARIGEVRGSSSTIEATRLVWQVLSAVSHRCRVEWPRPWLVRLYAWQDGGYRVCPGVLRDACSADIEKGVALAPARDARQDRQQKRGKETERIAYLENNYIDTVCSLESQEQRERSSNKPDRKSVGEKKNRGGERGKQGRGYFWWLRRRCGGGDIGWLGQWTLRRWGSPLDRTFHHRSGRWLAPVEQWMLPLANGNVASDE